MECVTEQSQQTRPLIDRSPEEIEAFLSEQRDAYEALKDRGLDLDLTRGKPSSAQLDLSDGLLSLPSGVKDPDGVDVRNYGGLAGHRVDPRASSPSFSGSSRSSSPPAATPAW